MKGYFYAWAGMALIIVIVWIRRHDSQQPNTFPIKKQGMKMNAGVITSKLAESKQFYQQVLNFGLTFENDFYMLLHTPDQQTSLAFLLPEHPSQQPIFQTAFGGKGVFLPLKWKMWMRSINASKTWALPSPFPYGMSPGVIVIFLFTIPTE